MSERHLSWPVEVRPLQTFGPGMIHNSDVTDPKSGVDHVRDYWDRSKLVYDGTYVVGHEEADRHDTMLDVFERMHGRAVPVWHREPIERVFRNWLVGYGDGTTKAFPVHLQDASSSPLALVAGAPVSAVYFESRANLLADDDDAAFIGALNWSGENLGGNSLARSIDFSYFGRYSCKIDPNGSQTGAAARSPKTASETITPGRKYLAGFWALGAATDVRCRIAWYEADDTPISNSTGSDVTLGTYAWTPVTVSATAPALAAKAEIVAINANTEDATWYIDCATIGGLETLEWWLPSSCPGVLVFTSAPASGAEVAFTGYGYGINPCRNQADQVLPVWDSVGNLAFKVKLAEVWEGDD